MLESTSYRMYPGPRTDSVDALVDQIEAGRPSVAANEFLCGHPTLDERIAASTALFTFFPDFDVKMCLRRALERLAKHELATVVDPSVLIEALAVTQAFSCPPRELEVFPLTRAPSLVEAEIRASIILGLKTEVSLMMELSDGGLDSQVEQILNVRSLALQYRFEEAFALWSKVGRGHPAVLLELQYVALRVGRLDFVVEHQAELASVPKTCIFGHMLKGRTAVLTRRWHVAGLSLLACIRWGAVVRRAGMRLGKDLEKSVDLLITEGVLRTS